MIEYILTLAETSLFQTICFIVGAPVFTVGLLTTLAAVVAANEHYKERGVMLIAAGALIALPAVGSTFVGFNSSPDLEGFPLWLFKIIYFAAPTCGTIQLVNAIKKKSVIRAQGVSNTVLIKKKHEGLSFVAKDGQILFECTGSNGENVVIIADNNEAAQNLALDHYQGVDFTIKPTTLNLSKNKQQTLWQFIFSRNCKKTLIPVKTNNIKKARIAMFSAGLLLGTSSLIGLILIPIGFYSSYPSAILTIFLFGLFVYLKDVFFSALDDVPAENLVKLETPNHIKEKNILIELSNKQGFLLEKQYKAAFLLVADEEKEAKERAVREEWGIK